MTTKINITVDAGLFSQLCRVFLNQGYIRDSKVISNSIEVFFSKIFTSKDACVISKCIAFACPTETDTPIRHAFDKLLSGLQGMHLLDSAFMEVIKVCLNVSTHSRGVANPVPLDMMLEGRVMEAIKTTMTKAFGLQTESNRFIIQDCLNILFGNPTPTETESHTSHWYKLMSIVWAKLYQITNTHPDVALHMTQFWNARSSLPGFDPGVHSSFIDFFISMPHTDTKARPPPPSLTSEISISTPMPEVDLSGRPLITGGNHFPTYDIEDHLEDHIGFEASYMAIGLDSPETSNTCTMPFMSVGDTTQSRQPLVTPLSMEPSGMLALSAPPLLQIEGITTRDTPDARDTRANHHDFTRITRPHTFQHMRHSTRQSENQLAVSYGTHNSAMRSTHMAHSGQTVTRAIGRPSGSPRFSAPSPIHSEGMRIEFEQCSTQSIGNADFNQWGKDWLEKLRRMNIVTSRITWESLYTLAACTILAYRHWGVGTGNVYLVSASMFLPDHRTEFERLTRCTKGPPVPITFEHELMVINTEVVHYVIGKWLGIDQRIHGWHHKCRGCRQHWLREFTARLVKRILLDTIPEGLYLSCFFFVCYCYCGWL